MVTREDVVVQRPLQHLLHPSSGYRDAQGDVGQSLNNLADVERGLGRYAEAEPLFKRSPAIREKALDPDHLDVVSFLNGLLGPSAGRGAQAIARLVAVIAWVGDRLRLSLSRASP